MFFNKRIHRNVMFILTILFLGLLCQAEVLDDQAAQLASEKKLKSITATSGPDAIYEAFNEFCKTHFGTARDPLIYGLCGKEFTLLEGGQWKHVSENSAQLAWETSLPAKSYVEYGLSEKYGQKTAVSERNFFLHLHALKDLEKNKTYHYRLVAEDEKGRKIVTPDATLTTTPVEGAIYIPGEAANLPQKLEKNGATYILTKDMTVAGQAFLVEGDDITIDLNGHTITYSFKDSKQTAPAIEVRGKGKGTRLQYQASNVKVLNGRMIQKDLPENFKGNRSYFFNGLTLKGESFELAGLEMVYSDPTAWAATISHPSGKMNFHHNTFIDKGAKVANRHGAGIRPIGFYLRPNEKNEFRIHHNLIKRTRQNGFKGANYMYNNEVYVDSWSTNSFALQPNSAPGVDAGEVHHNRVFATGFNPYGVGWAHENLKVHDNLFQMFGLDLSQRWGERWGDINMLEALRITNYGKGGQVRNNLAYWNNLVLLSGKEGCELRGTGFYSDNSIKNTVARENVIKVISLDQKTQSISCVSAQGHFQKEDTQPTYYRDSRLISNLHNIRFGDSYGKGLNHRFERCVIVKEGNRPDYHTIVFGGAFWSYGHVFLDCIFEGGAKWDDVLWERTSSRSSYSIDWTLTLKTQPGAVVTIKDKVGQEVFSGTINDKGELTVPLRQCTVRPTEWTAANEKAGKMMEVKKKSEHQLQMFTPHTVHIKKGAEVEEKTIEMTKPTTLKL